MSDTSPDHAGADAPAAPRSRHIQPAFTTVANWCDISGMGRSVTYDALGRGDLRAIKVGTRTLIDVAHGLAWLRSLPPAKINGRRDAA